MSTHKERKKAIELLRQYWHKMRRSANVPDPFQHVYVDNFKAWDCALRILVAVDDLFIGGEEPRPPSKPCDYWTDQHQDAWEDGFKHGTIAERNRIKALFL